MLGVGWLLGADCSGLLGRTLLRQLLWVQVLGQVEHCSGLLGRTLLRRCDRYLSDPHDSLLFRPSRPDSIETTGGSTLAADRRSHCSGLLGRTLLRPRESGGFSLPMSQSDCSGLLGRTLLRPRWLPPEMNSWKHCSGLLGRTLLRRLQRPIFFQFCYQLFRPSRPDSIETIAMFNLLS